MTTCRRSSLAFRGLAVPKTIAALVTSITVAVGCDQEGSFVASSCGEIPMNGCVLQEDDSECSDPCCAAAYTCSETTWSFDHSCASFSEALCHPDAAAYTANVPEGGTCRDASTIDAPAGAWGGADCIDLQPPDCPLSEALYCGPPGDVCNGCESLFYCSEGNWISWGQCTEDGGVVETN